jgi:hypothetical protein
MVERAIEKYHPELAKEKVSIDTVIVARLDKDEQSVHAMKQAGYPIDAKIGVTSLQDRARGLADAKLVIDGLEWNSATDRQRVALIDHEVEHLDLVPVKPTKKEPDRVGNKRDDLGRPCLRIRPHDWQLAGFKDVVERHGQHSHEAKQFANFRAEYAQLNLFGNEVLAIAEGKNGNGKKTAMGVVEDALRKVLKPGKGIDKVTISTGGVSVSSDDLKGSRSSYCQNRKHKKCDGCKCLCHQSAEARAGQ